MTSCFILFIFFPTYRPYIPSPGVLLNKELIWHGLILLDISLSATVFPDLMIEYEQLSIIRDCMTLLLGSLR